MCLAWCSILPQSMMLAASNYPKIEIDALFELDATN